MEKDLYKILELTDEDKNLPWNEFDKKRRANYLRLSKQWHPDRHVNDNEEDKKKAEDKFKEISAANDVLSDEEKRRTYDMGDNPFSEGSPFADFFTGGGFGSMFGDLFGRMGGRQRNSRPMGSNIQISVDITLQEVYNGGTREVSYYVSEPCHTCNGTGNKDGIDHTCKHCGGTGFVMENRSQGNTFFMQQSPCPYCHGTGKEHIGEKCHDCGGTGVKKLLKKTTIDIPKGVASGMAIQLQGKGNYPQGSNGIPGSLIVTFNVKDDSYYERADLTNLVHVEEVDIADCLLGFTKEFKCIDGSTVKVKANECTKDNEVFMFRGKGLPNVNTGGYGDFAVVVRYKTPKRLTRKQRELLEQFKKES